MPVVTPPPAPSSPVLDVPEEVQAWFRQLLDPRLHDIVRGVGEGSIEIHLYCRGGRVRKRPMILLNPVATELVTPDQI